MELLPLQRAWSITVAMVTLAEWICLGLCIPIAKEIKSSFRVDLSLIDWIVMSFHWVWCIPVGLLVAAALVVKDRRCPALVAGRINLAIFWVGLVIWVACLCVAFKPVFKLN